MIVIIILYAC